MRLTKTGMAGALLPVEEVRIPFCSAAALSAK